MKKVLFILLFFISAIGTYACPVCERNKPKILQGITHGSNPESNWDYVIVSVIGIIAILTLFYSIKYFINPNEKNSDHIKYSILKEQ